LENMLQEMELRIQDSVDQNDQWKLERKQLNDRLQDFSEQ